MCYRVVPDEPKLMNRTVHRSLVVPRHPDENVPREVLKHPSDHFFPTPIPRASSPKTHPVEGRNTNKKRKKDQPDEDKGDKASDIHTGPVEAELREKYLKEALENDKALSVLATPLADVLDDGMVEKIIEHTSKVDKNGNLIYTFKVLLENGKSMETISLADMKVDCPVLLSRYVLGVKAFQGKQKDKHRSLVLYATQMRKRHEKILRMTTDKERQLGIRKDIVGDQAGISLRRRAVGKPKPGRSNSLSPNRRKSNVMGSFKYGIYVPRNVDDALAQDEKNGNSLWREAIIKELTSLMHMKTFKLIDKVNFAEIRKKEKYQYAPLRMIFDVKQDLRRKARLVIGGHVIDSTGLDVYASNMETISARVLMLIASANKQEVLTGDIGVAYLYAKVGQKVYCRLGTEFSIYDESIKTGSLATVETALYGLPTSANKWHAHLAGTLLSMGFKPSRYDNDVWLRPDGKKSYDYIGTHTDDLMVVSHHAADIMETLRKTYTIKTVEPPRFHLGCDYKQTEAGDWLVGTKTYVKESLEKVRAIIGKETPDTGEDRLGKQGNPMAANYKPECDTSDLLDIEGHRKFQQLIGIGQWLITCGRLDLIFAIASLSRFSAGPRKGHFAAAVYVYKYLNYAPEKWIKLDPGAHKTPGPVYSPLDGQKENGVDWSHTYPDAVEELDPKFPPPRGVGMDTAVYFDSNWGHDEVTRRSITGVIGFIGNTPVTWLSKRQGAIATSTYSAELAAAKVGAEEAISLRYMLRSLGVPLLGRTLLIGDNLGSLISSCSPASPCKKKHTQIAFHYVRECNAAGILEIKKIGTEFNYADVGTKALDKTAFGAHFNRLFYKGN